MTSQEGMRPMRAMRLLLISRRMCGNWLPGAAVLCTRHVGHSSACGQW